MTDTRHRKRLHLRSSSGRRRGTFQTSVSQRLQQPHELILMAFDCKGLDDRNVAKIAGSAFHTRRRQTLQNGTWGVGSNGDMASIAVG